MRGDLITASSDNGRKDQLFALLVRGGYSVAITDLQIFRQFFQERLAAAELAPLRKAALQKKGKPCALILFGERFQKFQEKPGDAFYI